MWSSSCPCLARHARPAFVRDADEANAFSKLYRYERRRSGASNKGFQELRHTPGQLNTLNQTTFLFGTAHLRARPVFPRSSSNGAPTPHDAERPNVAAKCRKGRGCGGRKPPPVEAFRTLVQGLHRLLDLPLMDFVNHCAENFSILTAISSQPIPFFLISGYPVPRAEGG